MVLLELGNVLPATAKGDFVFTKHFGRTGISVLLSFLLLISTIPSMASDFPKSKVVLGAISGNGKVLLRGVGVNWEGTLFSGEPVQTGHQSYAKLMLSDGNKVELFSDTSSVVSRRGEEVRVSLTAGNVGFSASKSPFVISLSGFDVLCGAGAAGGVAFLNNDYVGIRVKAGSVLVRELATKKSFTVSAGGVHIINVKTQQTNVPLAQL